MNSPSGSQSGRLLGQNILSDGRFTAEKAKEFFSMAIRFGLSGVLNSAVGYLAFLLFLRGLGWAPAWSNAGAYIFGLTVFLVTSKKYVFRSTFRPLAYGVRFALVFLSAYSANLSAFFVLVSLWEIMPEIAQVLSMAVYSVVFLTLGRRLLARSRVSSAA